MIWFTADTHFGHTALLTKQTGKITGMSLRAVAWATVEEMDAAIVDAINSNVRPQDTLYHLGDWGMWAAAHYRMQIKCKDIRLIWGNHDKRNIAHLFRHTWEVKTVKLQHGQESVSVWLSHYAHFIWPKSHYGSLHLYGHSHGQAEERLDQYAPGRRSMDVGIDNVMRLMGSPRPISETEVLEILMAKPGHDPVELYR